MADNAFVKIGTALLKHQVKKLVGEEALGAIGEELADIGGDKLDSWLGDKSTIAEIEKAAKTAETCFHDSVGDHELEQWMVSLPIGDLPKVLDAIEKLPTSSDEKELEEAIQESIAGWRKLSSEQIEKAVNSFLNCLRSALLPIEKQTLMVIGRSVLRTEDKVDQLLKMVENLQAIRPETLHLKPDTPKGWFYGHRYGDLENFTGRAAEFQMLDEWLNNDKDNLLVLRALGGFGKSALTWQWFNNRVDKAKWQTAVWWSYYEKESGFESFLAETLNHLGVEVKASARLQLNDLLEAMRGTQILIVLDGFERLLRQYGRMDAALQSDDEDADIDPSQRDCSSPLTETFLRGLSGAGMKSKVLLTTRLCPRVLESADGKLLKGCREEPLAAFSPEDAVTYFHNEGIKATRAEITEACAAYGYHPLSLSLLVGLINADHERRGDIAAVKNLEIFADVKARRHHVLERAYGSLASERRDLLSKMSCFRGSMEYAVLKKVFPSPNLDKSLLDLHKRGLLLVTSSQHQPTDSKLANPQSTRFDMHPIVRHYAYQRLANKETVHEYIAKYFHEQVDKDIPEQYRNTPPQMRAWFGLGQVKKLEDLGQVIELYHHLAKSGNFDEAERIFKDRIDAPTYYQFGAYQLQVELLKSLFPDGEDKLPRLRNESSQAQILGDLAAIYSTIGLPHHVISLYTMHNILQKKIGNNINLAIGLGSMASVGQLPVGILKEAEHNLNCAIDLDKELGSQQSESFDRGDLGRLKIYIGDWFEAEQELSRAYEILEQQKNTQPLSIIWSYRALRSLLMAREAINNNQSQIENLKSSIECAQRALELTDEQAKNYPVPRDYVRAYWLLGSAYRANNELTLSEENLSKALNLCRQINLVEFEADILLDVARLRYAQSDFKDAQEKASEALVITERSGYVLQGADVNLFLAQYTLEQENDKAKAKQYAEEAKKLATCDGPPYYYKVAYDEAERMLEKLK